MRNPFLLAVVPLLLLDANPAPAQTTAEMMSNCQPLANALDKGNERMVIGASENTFDSGICWGAFRSFQALGALAFKDETGARRKKPVLEFCAPPNSNLTQFVRIFDQYARQHPESQHENYHIIALRALQSAFPCP